MTTLWVRCTTCQGGRRPPRTRSKPWGSCPHCANAGRVPACLPRWEGPLRELEDALAARAPRKVDPRLLPETKPKQG